MMEAACLLETLVCVYKSICPYSCDVWLTVSWILERVLIVCGFLLYILYINHICTNRRRQVTVVIEFDTLAFSTFGSSVWKLLDFTLLVPRAVALVRKTSGCDSLLNLRLRILHKNSICINNGKPTKMVNGITRHCITTTWIIRLRFWLITYI
jgi:hypothetical protein